MISENDKLISSWICRSFWIRDEVLDLIQDPQIILFEDIWIRN